MRDATNTLSIVAAAVPIQVTNSPDIRAPFGSHFLESEYSPELTVSR